MDDLRVCKVSRFAIKQHQRRGDWSHMVGIAVVGSKDTAHNRNYKSLIQWYRIKYQYPFDLPRWSEFRLGHICFWTMENQFEISQVSWLLHAANFDFVTKLKNLAEPNFARPPMCRSHKELSLQIALSTQTLNLYPKLQHKSVGCQSFPFLGEVTGSKPTAIAPIAQIATVWVFSRGSWFSAA